MSQIGDLVVDEGVTFVVTFDGRQSLLGVRRSMGPLITAPATARQIERAQRVRRRYGSRAPRRVVLRFPCPQAGRP